ncbi:hypothetical protein CHH83_01750 [Bacillus sp. 7586-K]|nr:hypothetical protein CHH83_01750 [Bacillus sp. 7586-K]
MTMVNAVQFNEDEYLKNKMSYIDVWDRATFSELWFDKTAIDGRYYVANQPNTFSSTEYTTVNDGDYLIREDGITFVIPKKIFEKHYSKLCD